MYSVNIVDAYVYAVAACRPQTMSHSSFSCMYSRVRAHVFMCARARSSSVDGAHSSSGLVPLEHRRERTLQIFGNEPRPRMCRGYYLDKPDVLSGPTREHGIVTRVVTS